MRVAQERALVVEIIASSTTSFQSPVGPVVLDHEGMFHSVIGSSQILWAPESAGDLKFRIMVCAHMLNTGHRSTVASLTRLQTHCW